MNIVFLTEGVAVYAVKIPGFPGFPGFLQIPGFSPFYD